MPKDENLAFLILLFSGSIEKLYADLKSAFSSRVFSNEAQARSHSLNTALVRLHEAKLTSLISQPRKTVFSSFSLINDDRFSMQFSKLNDIRKSVQFSNGSPVSLQSLNRTFLSAVPFNFTALKLQPVKVQSVKTDSERSKLVNIQFIKEQFSYSANPREELI